MPKPKNSPTKKSPLSELSVEELEAQLERIAEAKELAEAKEREAAKPKPSPEDVKRQKKRDKFYEENKKEIDVELERCARHLRKLDIEVARETARRLEAYFLSRIHG